MKLWVKILIIFLGCGLQGALVFCTTQWVEWAVVFGGISMAVGAAVGILTGFKPTTA
jgi:hypothetical protein